MDSATYANVIRGLPQLLDRVTHVGGSGGWDDLYTVVDFTTDAFVSTYPSLPCKEGCSHCCEEMLFRVSAPEWRALRAHLETWPEPDRAALHQRVRETYGPHREQLDALAHYWRTTDLGSGKAPLEGLPGRCPLLGQDGRCTAYEVRPMVCRSYGAMGVTIAGKPTMLICQAFGPAFVDSLAARGEASIVLGRVEPFYAALEKLEPGAAIGPLPWWLLQWADEATP